MFQGREVEKKFSNKKENEIAWGIDFEPWKILNAMKGQMNKGINFKIP